MSMATTNQRPESLSNLTCGSLIPDIFKDGFEKNTFKSTSITALSVAVLLPVEVVTAVPVTEGLLKTFMRQLAVAIICEKPTSPLLSGGV